MAELNSLARFEVPNTRKTDLVMVYAEDDEHLCMLTAFFGDDSPPLPYDQRQRHVLCPLPARAQISAEDPLNSFRLALQGLARAHPILVNAARTEALAKEALAEGADERAVLRTSLQAGSIPAATFAFNALCETEGKAANSKRDAELQHHARALVLLQYLSFALRLSHFDATTLAELGEVPKLDRNKTASHNGSPLAVSLPDYDERYRTHFEDVHRLVRSALDSEITLRSAFRTSVPFQLANLVEWRLENSELDLSTLPISEAARARHRVGMTDEERAASSPIETGYRGHQPDPDAKIRARYDALVARFGVDDDEASARLSRQYTEAPEEPKLTHGATAQGRPVSLLLEHQAVIRKSASILNGPFCPFVLAVAQSDQDLRPLLAAHLERYVLLDRWRTALRVVSKTTSGGGEIVPLERALIVLAVALGLFVVLLLQCRGEV